MVQILPYIPTPLEQLTPHIAQAAGSIGSAYGQHQRNKADQTILQQIQNIQSGQQGTSTIDLPVLWNKLSPATRKTYEPFLQSELRKQEAASRETDKRETGKLEKREKAESLLGTVKEMEDLIPYTGSTDIPWSPSFLGNSLNRGAVQKRATFDELAASAASFFRDLETKGQLPLGLYEKVIEPRLPSSKLSERQNKGRLEGLTSLAKRYGGLPEKEANHENESIKKSSQELSEGSAFEKLPSASEYPNAIFRKGDKRYMSNGKNWKEM